MDEKSENEPTPNKPVDIKDLYKYLDDNNIPYTLVTMDNEWPISEAYIKACNQLIEDSKQFLDEYACGPHDDCECHE